MNRPSPWTIKRLFDELDGAQPATELDAADLGTAWGMEQCLAQSQKADDDHDDAPPTDATKGTAR